EALWAAPNRPGLEAWHRLEEASFDYERRRMSVLADGPEGRLIVAKGAPESILDVCVSVPPAVEQLLDREFDAGARLVAVATRDGAGLEEIGPADEHDLTLAGFLAFVDPPKADAAAALERLASLGIAVKIVTGDNERVARKVCGDLGVSVERASTGTQLDGMPDEELVAAIELTTIFARVTPDQ
ncbi:MAG: HAD family hydrolase, partial [Actinomycetota bacterium]